MVAHRYWGLRLQRPSTSNSYIALTTLTMATSQGGANLCTDGSKAAADSYANDGNVPANLCDATSSAWTDGYGYASALWYYDFTSPVDIAEFSIQSQAGTSYAPTNFDLVYSDDASTWTSAAYFVTTPWTSGVSESRTFETSSGIPAGTYRYWGFRLRRPATSSTYTSMANVTMATTPGGTNLCTDGSKANADSYANADNQPAYAVDADLTTKWTSNPSNATSLWWYDFVSALTVEEFSIRSESGTTFTYTATDFDLIGSNDAVDWATVKTYTASTWSAGMVQTFEAPAAVATAPPPSNSLTASQVSKAFVEMIADYSALAPSSGVYKTFAEVIGAYSGVAGRSEVLKAFVEVIHSPGGIPLPMRNRPIIIICT